MSYSDRGTDRYKDGSLAHNDAEQRVEQYFAGIGRPLVRYGFAGVPTAQAVVTTWTPEVRHTPDYLGFGRFYEVKSCYDTHILIKCEDLDSLARWQGFARMPVWFALYQGRTGRIVLADLPSVAWACGHAETEQVVLDAGTKAEKPAWKIPMRLFVEEQGVVNAQEASKVHPVPTNDVSFWKE